MPLFGLIPFLHVKTFELLDFGTVCVNALIRAYPISTGKKGEDMKKVSCVNALIRAYPISTHLMARLF